MVACWVYFALNVLECRVFVMRLYEFAVVGLNSIGISFGKNSSSKLDIQSIVDSSPNVLFIFVLNAWALLSQRVLLRWALLIVWVAVIAILLVGGVLLSEVGDALKVFDQVCGHLLVSGLDLVLVILDNLKDDLHGEVLKPSTPSKGLWLLRAAISLLLLLAGIPQYPLVRLVVA